MPCMKDYGKTWDYDRGYYPNIRYVLTRDKDGRSRFEFKEMPPPKYRKIANQYGVCKFVRKNGK